MKYNLAAPSPRPPARSRPSTPAAARWCRHGAQTTTAGMGTGAESRQETWAAPRAARLVCAKGVLFSAFAQARRRSRANRGYHTSSIAHATTMIVRLAAIMAAISTTVPMLLFFPPRPILAARAAEVVGGRCCSLQVAFFSAQLQCSVLGAS